MFRIIHPEDPFWGGLREHTKTVYVASRFRNKPLVRAAGVLLKQAGHTPLHSWTEETADCPPEQAAERDLQEIRNSHAVLVLTQECELVPGGMHFEAGYALGRGKRVLVVGPLVNIFYRLPGVERYDTVERAVEALAEAALRKEE